MTRIFLNKKFYVVLLIDTLLITLSLYGAYAIRFDFQMPLYYVDTFLNILPWVIATKLTIFFMLNTYKGMWRYTSLVDILNLNKAMLLSSLLILVGVFFLFRLERVPRSVIMIDLLLSLILIGGMRLGIRLYYSPYSFREFFFFVFRQNQHRKQLVIIGAGNTGEKVIREIQDNPNLKTAPVGLLDDDPHKQSRSIHGIPVWGKIDKIERYVHLFDEILIAVPSASAGQMRRIVSLCEQTGKPYLTVPALAELIDGKVSVNKARKVTLNDLLGREEVHLNKSEIRRYIQNKRVLVTGAGGSIGSELVNQICRFEPEAVGLLDMCEFNLFKIDGDCRSRYPQTPITALLADIRDEDSLHRAFGDFRPDVVFHAAAYKHVPMQELHPWEAVRNNVIGTRNLLSTACAFQVDKFVMISTDKAVRPTNVMGATKRVAEKLVTCINNSNGHGVQCMVVRFGNVIGSSGSVIPTFREQIEKGGPVTVTHPEITRYFMSIPEAAQLVLEAGTMGTGGETFILEMGQPVKIADLARDLIRLSGYEPDEEIAIEYTGLRPGEKLYEELITHGEGIVATGHEKIMVLRGDICDLVYIKARIAELADAALTYDPGRIRRKLMEIVPDYKPNTAAIPLYHPPEVPETAIRHLGQYAASRH